MHAAVWGYVHSAVLCKLSSPTGFLFCAFLLLFQMLSMGKHWGWWRVCQSEALQAQQPAGQLGVIQEQHSCFQQL